MLKSFTVSPRSEAAFTPFTVDADSYREAANKASAKLNKGKTHALRVTGSTEKSGVFQGYRRLRDGSESSTGGQFHLIAE